MKKVIPLILLFTPFFSSSQTTAIPDAAFEQALINYGYDDILDGAVATENIIDITGLELTNMNIQDLTGIEAFESLIILECPFNQLTSLDMSQNEALVFLFCGNNALETLIMPEASEVFSELDVANNNLTHLEMINYTLIAWIGAFDNQLTSVDLSGSTIQFEISFSNNPLTEINLEGTTINYLSLNNTLISSLDLSVHPSLEWFSATGNSDLDCIKVSQAQLENIPSDPDTGLWTVDPTTSYALECENLSINTFETPIWSSFPNPCANFLKVNGLVTGKTYVIYDFTGKALDTGLLKNKGIINVQPLASGVYLLAIEGIGTKRFLKN